MNADRWQKIEQLYNAALERGESERTAFLADACAGDEALRREVESLLAQDEPAGKFLERPALLEVAEKAAKLFGEEPTQSLVGRQLGSYHVLAKLGEGGMGEVYRAKDTKLRRDVALKVLPKAFARDPERLARFEREAQILASLNHRNIAAIYGLENSDGVHFLVLELVEGETLVERIARTGPLPVKETLGISKQVAEALEYAHKKAVTHRDIKPANIKVTPEGEVKVLDFGLAKIFEGDRRGTDLSELPTLGPGPTRDGQILGTPSYMSPEQVRGQEVDKRSDIWAFGCLLYELLTGQRVFQSRRQSPDRKGGEVPPGTVADIIAAVLNDEPDWSALPVSTPTSLRTLLRRCLQKDANRRLHDVADARIEIEEALTAPATVEATVAQLPARPTHNVWRWAIFSGLACVIVVLAILATWNLKPRPAPAPLSVSRFTITLPAGQRLAPLDQPALVISPDGKNLVYVAIQSRDSNGAATNQGQAGLQQLYLRPLDSLESKPIAGTEGAVGPFFSPDGQWVGFFAGARLKKVSVNGGAAVTLSNAPNPGGASWSNQGILALQPSLAVQSLQQVPQEGGTPQPLTRLGKGEFLHRWPEFLPGGKAVLFASSATLNAWNSAQIVVSEVERPVGTGERKNPSAPLSTSLAQGTQPRYAATGHLLYAQGGTLLAAPFDARRLALAGAAAPALEGVMQSTATGAAQYSLSSTGTLAYLAGEVAGSQSRLVWVSRSGEEQPLPAPPHNYQFPRVSPDGWRVAVGIAEQEGQVWVYDASRDTLTRLTFEGTVNIVPAWSPDGRRIAFGSNRAGPTNLFWQAADGSGGAERLTTSDYLNTPNSFSPDGQLLAFVEANPETGRDIWVLRLADPGTLGQAGQGPRQAGAEGRKAQPFLRTPYDESAPKFSPDGKWLAYSSDESGRREIYVQPYPGPGGKWQISTDGGQEPVWNPKGRELFYRSGNKMMVVDVDTNSGFSAGKPRMLFEGPYLPTSASFPYYDISPDGQRFLMLKPVESQTSGPTQIHIVLNWFEELKRRVPPAK